MRLLGDAFMTHIRNGGEKEKPPSDPPTTEPIHILPGEAVIKISKLKQWVEDAERHEAERVKAMFTANILRAELKADLVLLNELEWSDEFDEDTMCCPSCHYWEKDGHTEDCSLAARLKRLQELVG